MGIPTLSGASWEEQVPLLLAAEQYTRRLPRGHATLPGLASGERIVVFSGVNSQIERRSRMAQQSSAGGRPKLSEKGLLTPDNCVVALIDHQPQMLFGVSNFDRQLIINNTVALGKAARVFGLPVVLSTVETKSFSGNMWPQLRAVFPGQEPIERSSMNSWDDK